MKALNHPLSLALFSGILFYLGWPTLGFPIFLWIAFVPLLLAENSLRKSKNSGLKIFGLAYISFLIWNFSTTAWLYYASLFGVLIAVLVNSLLMALVFLLFHWVAKKSTPKIYWPFFISIWLVFEKMHLHWEFSWPWLNLGNGFSEYPSWIQWYEYTGTSGGTLWVLLVNVLLFQLIRVRSGKDNIRGTMYDVRMSSLLLISAALALPIILSLFINNNRSSKHPTSDIQHPTSNNIVVIQPNIDPYEKLSTGTFDAQLQKLIRLSESKIDSNTTLLVWPETALYSPNGFDEVNLKQNFFLNPLFDFLRRHPKINLFTGIESYRVYPERVSASARPIDGTSDFYEVYNGSAVLDSSGALQLYHKSMLVPGVETLPRFLLFLGPVFEKLGGTAGGYARQEERTPLPTNNGYVIAPAICYESIYGEYMSRYVKAGANIIAVITNDGWWGNTPGYKHHMLYGKLRAIETRKWVLRSANTGISCFIDPMGNDFESQPWWTEAAIKKNIPVNTQQTFFVRFGDLLSKLALILTAALLLFAIYQKFTGKSSKQL